MAFKFSKVASTNIKAGLLLYSHTCCISMEYGLLGELQECVCVFFILYHSTQEGGKMQALSSESKLTKLGLQIG